MMNLIKFSVTICLALLCGATMGQDLPQQYREPFAKSWPIREQQHLQMKAYLDSFTTREQKAADATFQLNLQDVAAYQESLSPARAHLRKVKGLPPPGAIENPKPRFELVAQDQNWTLTTH